MEFDSMKFTSQKFIVTKIRKPKSVYIINLNIEENDVLQISFNLNLRVYVLNLSKNISLYVDRSDLKRIFDTTGCIDFIEINPDQLIENNQQQSAISL